MHSFYLPDFVLLHSEAVIGTGNISLDTYTDFRPGIHTFSILSKLS